MLQLEPAAHYGGAWASHHMAELAAMLRGAQPGGQLTSSGGGTAADAEAASVSCAAVYEATGADLGPSHEYNIDLAPKASDC